MEGTETGTTICQSRRQWPAPSISAASRMEAGQREEVLAQQERAEGRCRGPGRMMPHKVFLPPIPAIRM